MTPPIAHYAGYQPGFGAIPGFAIFTLLAPLPGHPAGSTVSEHTLREHGVNVPRLRGLGTPPPRDSGCDDNGELFCP